MKKKTNLKLRSWVKKVMVLVVMTTVIYGMVSIIDYRNEQMDNGKLIVIDHNAGDR